MLPYMEQPAIFNAVNFDWNVYAGENVTIAGIGISVPLVPERRLGLVDAAGQPDELPRRASRATWNQAYSQLRRRRGGLEPPAARR